MNCAQRIVVCLLQVWIVCHGFIAPCDPSGSLCHSPTPKLQIFYGGQNIACNTELTIAKTTSPPVIKYAQGEGQTFVLVMSDPDVPVACSLPDFTYLHQLAVGTVTNGVLNITSEIFNYFGPHPPFGIHRYQFRLFPLPARTATIKHASSRRGFSLTTFERDNHFNISSAVFQLRVPAA